MTHGPVISPKIFQSLKNFRGDIPSSFPKSGLGRCKSLSFDRCVNRPGCPRDASDVVEMRLAEPQENGIKNATSKPLQRSRICFFSCCVFCWVCFAASGMRRYKKRIRNRQRDLRPHEDAGKNQPGLCFSPGFCKVSTHFSSAVLEILYNNTRSVAHQSDRDDTR